MSDIVERCNHDIAERETACFDGMCPLCMANEIEQLEAALEDERKAHQACVDMRNDAEAEIVLLRAVLRRLLEPSGRDECFFASPHLIEMIRNALERKQ